MKVVVPYTCKRSWPFPTQEINFLYQEAGVNLVTIYFPTTVGRNIMVGVPVVLMHEAILEYVQTHILNFVEDEKYQDELKGFFVEPVFDIHQPGVVTLGKIVINVWEMADSCG